MDWKFLTRLYQNAPVSPGWLTKNLGANKDYSPLPKVRIVSSSGTLSMAKLGKVYDPAHAVKVASGVNEMLVDPAQIYEYDILTEELLFAENYNPQVLAVQSASDVVSSKDFIYAKKLAKLKERVQNRIEWMFAQMISTGGITYNDGETLFNVSYGVNPTNYSLNANTKIVSDLKDIVKEMKSKGFSPTHIILTEAVEKALWDNTQFMKSLESTSVNLGTAVFEVTEPFVTYVAKLNNLPQIFSYGGSIDGVDLISGNKIIVVDANACGIAYGAIINTNLDPTMRPIQTDVASWEAVSKEGDEKYLFVKSRPLPYIANANAVKILNVSL